jgi:hypothetical protein
MPANVPQVTRTRRFALPAPDDPPEAHELLRFWALVAIAVLKLGNLFGGIWDIQWHVAIGRDSLWIPPHLLVLAAFASGLAMVIGVLVHETRLARVGVRLEGTIQLGPIYAPLAFFGIFLGYAGSLLSGGFDELWHRIFGLDVTLWSPPHLAIMLCTMVVDYSLLLGLAASARRLGWRFEPRRPYFWAFILVGAYTFEAVNFQMAQAFIVSFHAQGAGLIGLLFPILVGSLFPMSLLLILGLSRRYWTAILVFLVTLPLEYVGIGLAAAGFAILRPVSVVEDFVRTNPDSTIALARQFARAIGFGGLIGFEQAWTMMLSGVPLALVSLLELWPWARRRLWVAAPVYGAGLVLTSYAWFQLIPTLKAYRIAGYDVALAVALAASFGLLFGAIGLWLARLGEESAPQPAPAS